MIKVFCKTCSDKSYNDYADESIMNNNWDQVQVYRDNINGSVVWINCYFCAEYIWLNDFCIHCGKYHCVECECITI